MSDQFWKSTHGKTFRACKWGDSHKILVAVGSTWNQYDERKDTVWKEVATVKHWKQGKTILEKLSQRTEIDDPVAYIERAAARKRGENVPEPQQNSRWLDAETRAASKFARTHRN